MAQKFGSKIYDGIIGVATGDALGVPVEFQSRMEIAKNPVTSMRGYGTHHQPEGTWSDDTSLTLALLDSIAENCSVNYTDIMDKFSQWLMHGEYTAAGEVFDVGNATSRAIMSYGRGMNPLECGGVAEYENGNGSLMRILPIGYYIHMQPDILTDERMKLVHDISSLTHRHTISLAGCGIYINIALKLLDGLALEEGIEQGTYEAFQYYEKQGWDALRSYDRIKDLDTFSTLSENDIRSSGYIVDTLEAAIWCLLNTNSFQECVLKAVNLGDDTDTVGAVAGGLAGIYYTSDNIPRKWLDTLQKRQYIEEVCVKFVKGMS